MNSIPHMESRKSMWFFIRSRDKRFPYVIPQIGELPTGLSKKDLANEDSFLAVATSLSPSFYSLHLLLLLLLLLFLFFLFSTSSLPPFLGAFSLYDGQPRKTDGNTQQWCSFTRRSEILLVWSREANFQTFFRESVTFRSTIANQEEIARVISIHRYI